MRLFDNYQAIRLVRKESSLLTRAWVVVLMIGLVVGLLGVVSVYWSSVASMDAHAINHAGSVRMATFRINYELATAKPDFDRQALADDMNERLHELRRYQSQSGNEHKTLDDALATIERLWQNELFPALMAGNNDKFYAVSVTYLSAVNDFVLSVQKRSEIRSRNQQYLHIITLLSIIITMLLGMRELSNNALKPLQGLTALAKAYKQEQPNLPMPAQGYKELNELSDAMMTMLITINNHQDTLKTQITQKTKHLLNANKALYVLYNFAKTIATENLTSTQLQALVGEFCTLMPDSEFSLCLHNENYENNVILALSPQKTPQFCARDDCDECELKTHTATRVIPIQSGNTTWGELLIKSRNNRHTPKIPLVNLDDNEFLPKEDLLMTMANLVALALRSNEQKKHEQELILSEERNTLARELHDSIAQALSYLKIQVTLSKNLSNDTGELLAGDQSALDVKQLKHNHACEQDILSRLDIGLQEAYSQLRELLTTFRLRIDGGDFNELMRHAADEFAQKGGFGVAFDNQILTLNLSASEQIDLLQIAREALSNVQKHAKASLASVVLYQDDASQEVILIVKDNGVGLSAGDTHKQGHYGLSTMTERANNLGGTIRTTSLREGGVEVMVRFLPQFFLKKARLARPKPVLFAEQEIFE